MLSVAHVLAFVTTTALSDDARAQTAIRAQTRIDSERDRRPRPGYSEDQADPTIERPAVPPLPDLPSEAQDEGFVLRGFKIRGSTVFSERELATAVAPFLDRRVHPEHLALITDTLTRLYIDAGYVTSGAVVPDQTVEDGVLEIHVIEGRVGALEVETSGRLWSGYVEHRVRSGLAAPLNLGELEQSLQILQQDARIARVDAVVVPLPERGQARVRLEIEEAKPYALEARIANDLAPSLGGRRAMATLEHLNVTGLGDTFLGTVSGARGLFDIDLSYRMPLTPWLTSIEIFGGLARGEVVEGELTLSNLETFRNEIERYGIDVIQPLWRSINDEVLFVVGLEHRRSRLTLGDDDFFLELNGLDGNTIRLFMLRTSLDWVHRTQEEVFSAWLRATVGLDAYDSTTGNGTPGAASLPDAEFASWLLQLQYARRVPTLLGTGEVVARSDLQLATGALFSLEAFAMGGASTVRGYHENRIVSDNGWVGSLEFRLPVLPQSWRPHDLRIAPFVDAGFAWDDEDRDEADDFERLFASVGLGLVYTYGDRFEMRIDWAEKLPRDGGSNPEGDDIQDSGVHIEARVLVF